MTDTALFIGWGGVYPGREHHAFKLFDETKELFAELKRQGEIVEFEPVLLFPHGGELDGYFLVKGEPAKLAAIQMRPDMEKIRIEASACFAKLSIIPATVGDDVKRFLTQFDEAVTEIEREPALV